MNTHLTLVAVCLILFCSCKEKKTSVTFSEPQPNGLNNLKALPSKYHGKFKNDADSTELLVDHFYILKIYRHEGAIHRSELTKEDYVSGDTLINRKTGEKLLCKTEGDTLRLKFVTTDTVFDISKDIVRTSKGAIFLNCYEDEGVWKVKKVSMDRKAITISAIAVDELEHGLPFEKLSRDSIMPAHFKATKKQFKAFVKNGGFQDIESFVKSD